MLRLFALCSAYLPHGRLFTHAEWDLKRSLQTEKQRELKQALLCAASKTVTIEVDIDDRVDEMIGWADMSDDGVVTFEVRVRPPPLPKART